MRNDRDESELSLYLLLSKSQRNERDLIGKYMYDLTDELQTQSLLKLIDQ